MNESQEIIPGENTVKEKLAHDVALQLRQKTMVYVPIEVQVMKDYIEKHPDEDHRKVEDNWAEKYSPAFEKAFLYVVQGIVSRSEDPTEPKDVEKLGQDFLSQKKEIAHMIEDELYKEAA